MLQGRYKVPPSKDPKSLLARYELGLFEENRAALTAASHHRSDEVNRLVLPQCQSIIEAIGHRMAYDAAVAAGVQQNIIDLYVASCVKLDLAWYSENADFGRRALADFETKALDALLPDLGTLIRQMGVEPWINSKIVSDERWNSFVNTCQVFEGKSNFGVFRGETVLQHESQMVRSHL